MREPTRRFIAPNGRIVTQPLRDLPLVADEPEVRDRIREATSLFHEPECPSKATVDAIADLGRTHSRLRHAADVEQREQDRQALTGRLGAVAGMEARMLDVRRRAKLQRVDVSRELHVMRKDLERARGSGRQPDGVGRRLIALEARLDHRPDLEEAA